MTNNLQSVRTYNASLRWRSGAGRYYNDPCYCFTTTHNHPEDVCSDDEPIFELDQRKWIGEKVIREEMPRSESAALLSKYLILMLDPITLLNSESYKIK